jgi:DNA repair protein RadA/Sms
VEEGERARTGIGELDRVLGGGVVRGSLVLVGGEPGAGKSTLLMQTSRLLAAGAGSVLYVSGEESAAQVKMRADRLGVAAESLYFLAETDLTAIEAHVAQLAPKVLVVDSIQTMFLPGWSRRPAA